MGNESYFTGQVKTAPFQRSKAGVGIGLVINQIHAPLCYVSPYIGWANILWYGAHFTGLTSAILGSLTAEYWNHGHLIAR